MTNLTNTSEEFPSGGRLGFTLVYSVLVAIFSILPFVPVLAAASKLPGNCSLKWVILNAFMIGISLFSGSLVLTLEAILSVGWSFSFNWFCGLRLFTRSTSFMVASYTPLLFSSITLVQLYKPGISRLWIGHLSATATIWIAATTISLPFTLFTYDTSTVFSCGIMQTFTLAYARAIFIVNEIGLTLSCYAVFLLYYSLVNFVITEQSYWVTLVALITLPTVNNAYLIASGVGNAVMNHFGDRTISLLISHLNVIMEVILCPSGMVILLSYREARNMAKKTLLFWKRPPRVQPL